MVHRTLLVPLTWLLLAPACTPSSPSGGTDGGAETDTDSGGSGGVMKSPLVADCELPSTGSDCGALHGCSSGGGGSSSGGSPSVDPDCEMENEAVEACIVAAARAGAPFEFSNSNLNGSGQYGWVGSISVGADGARSEKDYEYYDLCAEVRAELYGPADLTDCDDFTCVEDRLRAAEHVRSCGPEEQCGI